MPSRQEIIDTLNSIYDEWDEQALRRHAKELSTEALGRMTDETLNAMHVAFLKQEELKREEVERRRVAAEAELERYRVTMEPIEKRIQDAVKAAGGESGIIATMVNYSAYETASDGSVIDNLDDVAVEGTVRFIADRDEYWGGVESANYTSPEVTNPTWLQVAVFANEAIWITNDHHHVFLEGISKVKDGKVEFYMGS